MYGVRSAVRRSSWKHLASSSALVSATASPLQQPSFHQIPLPVRRFSDEATDSSCPKESVPGDSSLAYEIAGLIQNRPWNPSLEQDLLALGPIPSAVLHRVLCFDLELECAARFLTWVGRRDACELTVEDVRQTACIWAQKYGPRKLSSLTQHGPMLSEAVWAALMAAHTMVKQPSEVVSLFGKMRKSGVKPTALSCDALLFSLLKADRTDDALSAAEEMVSAGILPECKVLGVFLDYLCKSGKSEPAYNFVQRIGKVAGAQYYESAYSRFITASWRSVKPGLTYDLLYDMKERGLKPDRQAYNACIKSLCRQHKFQEVYNVLKDMYESNCAPDSVAYAALINGLYDAKKAEEALNIFEQIRNKHSCVDSKVLTIIINCLFACNNTDGALDLFHSMLKEGCIPDVVAYGTIVRNLCDRGKVTHAMDLKKDMIDRGLQPDARLYHGLANGLCRAGQFEELVQVICEMKVNTYVPDAHIYHGVVTYYCTKGDLDLAKIWAKEMISIGHKLTPYVRIKLGPSLGDDTLLGVEV